MMSYADLYLGASGPLVSSGSNNGGGSGSSGNAAHDANSGASQKSDPACRIFGVPFDATHSYRPGCRFGPDSIRSAFHNIEVFHPSLGIDVEGVSISDLGNMPHTASSSVMLDSVGRVASELAPRNNSDAPVIVLGGEHLVTYGSYMAYPDDVGYVVFDAHYDLRDTYGDLRFNHATYLRRMIEKRNTAQNMLHVGARAFAAEEAAFLTDCDINLVCDADVRSGKGPEMIRDFASSYDRIYASFDLDFVDPAFAPGVGNPEPEGATSREFFEMVRAIATSDARVVGSDIVEMNPTYDNGATASLAAKLLSMLVAMTAS